MSTFEVAQNHWKQFCDRIRESARGAMVSIQNLQSDGLTATAVDSRPLLSVFLDDKSDACNNILAIETGLPGEKSVRHVIEEPIRILLRGEHGSDRYHRMEILAENGTTLVIFHPGLTPDLLGDGKDSAKKAKPRAS